MPTSSGRCERILALIDACLEEMGALANDEASSAQLVTVGTDQEGGPAA
jgi:hypothetical protein